MIKWRTRFGCQPDGFRTESRCSFGGQDPERVFDSLNLRSGDCFLDAGCGLGEYSLPAAERVGPTGAVIALDRDPHMIRQLRRDANTSSVNNIMNLIATLGAQLPLRNQSADVCLISSVLHMPGLDDRWEVLFTELHRVLRHGARLGIIEAHKSDVSPELPLHLRLTPETIITGIQPYGFKWSGLIDLSSSYLVWFERA